LGIIYPSARTAALDHRLDAVTINHAAGGKHHMTRYGGFTWRYMNGMSFPDGYTGSSFSPTPRTPGPFAGYRHTNETRAKMAVAKMNKRRALEALDDNGRIVHYFESWAAASAAGHDKSNIADCLRVQGRKHHGLRWRRARTLRA
jgi:hypothetical protein